MSNKFCKYGIEYMVCEAHDRWFTLREYAEKREACDEFNIIRENINKGALPKSYKKFRLYERKTIAFINTKQEPNP